MNQTPKRVDMRTTMPATAQWVDKQRAEWGAAHVNTCIRLALAGQPGEFYALEAGHVMGVPFPATHAMAAAQNYAVMCGVTFAGFMREPAAKDAPCA